MIVPFVRTLGLTSLLLSLRAGLKYPHHLIPPCSPDRVPLFRLALLPPLTPRSVHILLPKKPPIKATPHLTVQAPRIMKSRFPILLPPWSPSLIRRMVLSYPPRVS